jgi:Domain of unknown function (DUF4383)
MAHALPRGRSLGDLARNGTLAQTGAIVVGAMFIVVGILGFIPGITTHYGDMTFAGHDSGAKLLGVFEVSVLHNLVHLLFGIVGLALARTHVWARAYLVVGGVAYLGVWLYGLAVDKTSDANFLPMNDADDWLHFILGAAMVALGVLAWRSDRRVSDLR